MRFTDAAFQIDDSDYLRGKAWRWFHEGERSTAHTERSSGPPPLKCRGMTRSFDGFLPKLPQQNRSR